MTRGTSTGDHGAEVGGGGVTAAQGTDQTDPSGAGLEGDPGLVGGQAAETDIGGDRGAGTGDEAERGDGRKVKIESL